MSEKKSSKTTYDNDWQYDIFHCCDDWGLCLCTFFVPCYTIGRNAEYFEEHGMTIGVGYGLGMLSLGALLRYRIRQEKGIRGNMLADALHHCLCPCCSLIQENKEIYGLSGSHLGEKVPLNQSMARH